MGAKLDGLTPQKIKAIEALVSGETSERAALFAGVNIRTLFKWKSEDETFQQALREAEKKALDETTRQLALAGVKAVKVLADIANDPAEKSAVRVSAAGKILDSLLRYAEISETRQRLEAIEAMLGLMGLADTSKVV